MIKATHNDFLDFLYQIIQTLFKRNQFERWLKTLSSRAQQGSVGSAIEVHKAIFEALRERDELLAEKRIREHFQLF